MSKRETDIEILKHEITSLKHLVAEIKKDAVKKENDEFILSQMPTEEQQQVAALSKEIHRREAELKQLIELANQEAREAEEDAFMANLPEPAEDILQLPFSGTLAKKNGPAAVTPDIETVTGKAVKAPAIDPLKIKIKEVSPVFRKLADPQLPELPSDDRARLQLQSPNRLFFYWSSRANPYDNLQRLFGARFSGYDLAIRLINLKDDSVRVMPADKSGTTWFDVSSDSGYRAELGFFSQNKPFIRVMYSNTIQTPRPSPSRRLASDADFAVRTTQFADVLSASGYAHENIAQNFAFSDKFMADTRAREIAGRLSEKKEEKETFKGIDLAELRWVLVSLAAYIPLDELKMSVSPELIAWLEELQAENPNALKPESVSSELERSLGGEFVQSLKSGEIETRKRYVHKVFGGSAVDVFETFVPQLVEFPAPKEKTRHQFDAPTSRVK